MLNPRLTTCVECTTIQTLLIDIDLKMFHLSKDLYNNVVFMLNRSVDASSMFDLLNYKRILTYKYYNSDYASDFTVEMVADRVKKLTVGKKRDCMCEDNTTYTLTTTTTTTATPTTTTTTSSTTSTTSTTSTSTSSTTTTTTTTATPTTTTTTTI